MCLCPFPVYSRDSHPGHESRDVEVVLQEPYIVSCPVLDVAGRPLDRHVPQARAMESQSRSTGPSTAPINSQSLECCWEYDEQSL